MEESRPYRLGTNPEARFGNHKIPPLPRGWARIPYVFAHCDSDKRSVTRRISVALAKLNPARRTGHRPHLTKQEKRFRSRGTGPDF